MKHYRMVAVLTVFAVLLALVPAGMAQDMTFGLSDEDYAALTAANTATSEATSAQFAFTADLTFAGDGETGTINLSGNGAFDTPAEAFQLVLNGTADFGDEESGMPLNAELRSTGGSFYFQAPALLGPQWLEITPDELGAMTEGMTEGMPFSPDALASGDASGMEGMTDAMMALATLQPEEYVSMTRNGDQFTTVVDVTGLLGSEEIQAAIREGVAANADEMAESGMSEAEINEMLAALPTALEGSSLTVDQYIADGMISRTVIDLVFNVDPAVMGEEGDAASIALNFDLNLSGYNQPVTIAVPENAMLLSEMMSGMSGAQ